MTGRDDEDHLIGGEVAIFQMRIVVLTSHQANVNASLFNVAQDRLRVGDGRAHLNLRIAIAEGQQQLWQEMFAGNGAGGQDQLAADGLSLAGDLGAGLAVQIENAQGVRVQTAAGIGQRTRPPCR